MRFEIKVSGLEEVRRGLEKLQTRAEGISGEQEVRMSELLTLDFLAKYTEFDSLDEMFSASGFEIEAAEDFEKIPDDEWDSFIRSQSEFSDWGEMLGSSSKARAWVSLT